MEKLIKEYKEKVIGIDNFIKTINNQLSLIRNKKYSISSKDDLLNQKSGANIQRQILIQVIEDLKDLV